MRHTHECARGKESNRYKRGCRVGAAQRLALQNGFLKTNLARMDEQLIQYVPVLMLGALAVAFAAGTLVMSVVVGKVGKRYKVKDMPYECGMLPVGEGSTRLSVKFYLVAMLFIL